MKSKPTEWISGYRIVAPRWAHDAFSGEGARKFGGRWNSPGNAMVYTGGTRALAALEMLVHLTTPLSRAKTYRILEIKIPAELVDHYPAKALPKDWREAPPGKSTMQIGDDWLRAGRQLALSIPSIIIPEEHNLLLNPQHREFAKLQISEALNFHFDPRLGQ